MSSSHIHVCDAFDRAAKMNVGQSPTYIRRSMLGSSLSTFHDDWDHATRAHARNMNKWVILH